MLIPKLGQTNLITLMFPENYRKNYILKIKMVREVEGFIPCNQTDFHPHLSTF